MTGTAARAESLDVDGLLSGFAADVDAQPLAANTPPGIPKPRAPDLGLRVVFRVL